MKKTRYPINSFVIIAALIYFISSVGAAWVLGVLELSAPLRIVVALLPALGFILLVAAHIELFRGADELQQRILLELWAYGLAAAIFGALILYFLQKAGFLTGWNYFGDVMMPFIFIGLIFGYWNTSRRYL